jgi:hypothetical protein
VSLGLIILLILIQRKIIYRSIFVSDSPNIAYWHFAYEETGTQQDEEESKSIYMMLLKNTSHFGTWFLFDTLIRIKETMKTRDREVKNEEPYVQEVEIRSREGFSEQLVINELVNFEYIFSRIFRCTGRFIDIIKKHTPTICPR